MIWLIFMFLDPYPDIFISHIRQRKKMEPGQTLCIRVGSTVCPRSRFPIYIVSIDILVTSKLLYISRLYMYIYPISPPNVRSISNRK